jgi:hypothetical protein
VNGPSLFKNLIWQTYSSCVFWLKIETSVDKEKPRQSLIYDRSHFKIRLRKRFRAILLLRDFAIYNPAWGQCHQNFWCQSREVFEKIFFALLMVTAFGKNVPKYGVQG